MKQSRPAARTCASELADDALRFDLPVVWVAEVGEGEGDGHAFAGGTEDLDHWGVGLSALGTPVEAVAAQLHHCLAAQLAQALDMEAVVLQTLHLHHWDFVSLVEQVASCAACDRRGHQ